ncbi:hypothetical protein ACH5RR_030329 [Cinchona calisaya]|uniref:FBD domain-containing protein n=1 Tax=Cinchona calisaya TaxID=153742 RepID=A0ABD2YUC7_9GENT
MWEERKKNEELGCGERQVGEGVLCCCIPKRLTCYLKHLKTVDFGFCCLEKVGDLSCVLCLIRSSPNLSFLKIKARNTGFPLHQLKEVKMKDFTGFSADVNFVKLLFASATVLEKMEIQSVYESGSFERYCVLKDLARLPLASPKAELIYQDGFG